MSEVEGSQGRGVVATKKFSVLDVDAVLAMRESQAQQQQQPKEVQKEQPELKATEKDEQPPRNTQIDDDAERYKLLARLRAAAQVRELSEEGDEEFDAAEVFEDEIWVGSLQATQDVENLRRLNIQSILTTARGLEVKIAVEFRHFVVPMADHPAEDLLGKLEECFRFLDEERAQNRRVLVHCASGVSRSVSVCVAYTMFQRKWNLEASLQNIRRNRAFAKPNVGFLIQLSELEATDCNIAAAKDAYFRRIKGKSLNITIRKWRKQADEVHAKVDDLENKIQSCRQMPAHTRAECIEELKDIVKETEEIAVTSSLDRFATMTLSSARSKSERLQELLESS